MSFLLARNSRALYLFFFFSFLFLTGALLRPLNGGGDMYSPEFTAVGRETLSVQIIGAIIYLVSIVYLIWHWKKLRLSKELLLTLAIVALALSSATWSDEPAVVVRRSLALAGTTLFGIAVAISLDRQQILFLLNRFIVIFIVTTALLAIVFPSFSFHEFGGFDGILRGSFAQKNDLGHVIGLFLVVLAISGSKLMSKRIWIFFVGLCSALLIATRSMGSVVAVILAIGGTSVIVRVASIRSSQVRILLWLALAPLTTLVSLIWSDLFAFVLDLLDRDPTLSDRTQIWDYVLMSGEGKWLLGVGYGVAWIGGVADVVKSGMAASMANAHNGFLEIWLQLGVVGVAMVVMLLVFVGSKLISNVRKIGGDRVAFERMSIALLIYVAIANITTVRLLSYNDITWSLIVIVVYLADFRVWYTQGARRTNPSRTFAPSAAG
jgi:O-antigen ligase